VGVAGVRLRLRRIARSLVHERLGELVQVARARGSVRAHGLNMPMLARARKENERRPAIPPDAGAEFQSEALPARAGRWRPRADCGIQAPAAGGPTMETLTLSAVIHQAADWFVANAQNSGLRAKEGRSRRPWPTSARRRNCIWMSSRMRRILGGARGPARAPPAPPPRHPAQDMPAQAAPRLAARLRDLGRGDQGLAKALGHGLDPAGQVDGGADDGEVEALAGADVAVGHRA
jgi:hypothetical protein